MDIVPKLKHFLALEKTADTNKDISAIEPDEDLLADGIIDSMVLLKLVSFIEETFAVKVFDEDVTRENFGSFRAMQQFIEQKKS